MGLFLAYYPSLASGAKHSITKPPNMRGIRKIYTTSTNLISLSVQTETGINDIPKAANTQYNNYFPLEQAVGASVQVIPDTGGAVAEAITMIIEWF